MSESRIIASECKKAAFKGADKAALLALSNIMIKQLGKPYVYGAAGPDSFDCSGLVQYVYGALGIELPRIVREQANAGVCIEKDDLIFGDLVFFTEDIGSLTHVGIYIGDDYFIHAPSTGENVMLSSLNTDFYSAIYKTAVRILK